MGRPRLLSLAVIVTVIAIELRQTAAARVALPVQEASSPRVRKPAVSLATRGRQLFSQQCAFCHGADARGGAQGGSDLLQSPVVLGDKGGRELAKFLAVGRPEKNMPKFDLPQQRVAELAAFLHARVDDASGSRFSVSILLGDPKAGEAYFTGVGGCTTCHSVTGDLKGIGAKYEPVMLQGRMVVPRGRGGYPGSENDRDKPLQATITPESGPPVTGAVLYISDFHVTIKEPSGRRRTFARRGDVPKVALVDPIQAHLALLRTLSDSDMHNLTAYLAALK